MLKMNDDANGTFIWRESPQGRPDLGWEGRGGKVFSASSPSGSRPVFAVVAGGDRLCLLRVHSPRSMNAVLYGRGFFNKNSRVYVFTVLGGPPPQYLTTLLVLHVNLSVLACLEEANYSHMCSGCVRRRCVRCYRRRVRRWLDRRCY